MTRKRRDQALEDLKQIKKDLLLREKELFNQEVLLLRKT